MPTFEKDLLLPENLSRNEIRQYVINEFLDEEAGTGTGDLTTKYTYTVERLATSNIVLKRPATLNKGMDFTVHVIGKKFREKFAYQDRPKHQEIIDDMIALKQSNPNEYSNLAKIIHQIYQCQPYDKLALKNLVISSTLLTAEEIALTLNWLFIEQDITYWNWSGRGMLYQALIDNNLL